MKIKVLVPGIYERINDFTRHVSSSITLIQLEDKNIIVDTGNRQVTEQLLKALEQENLKPEDINIVINTHLHLDHIWNNYLFTNATVIHPTHDKFAAVSPEGHLSYIDSITGLKLEHAHGHLDELMVIYVNIDNKIYCIANDIIATKKDAEIVDRKHFLHKDNSTIVESRKQILEKADFIITGHEGIINNPKR